MFVLVYAMGMKKRPLFEKGGEGNCAARRKKAALMGGF